jgi:hypothetical protein
MTLRGNKSLFFGAGVAASLLLCAFLFNFMLTLKEENSNLKASQKELALLKDDYLVLQAKVGAVEGKKTVADVKGVVQAVDTVFRSLGLNEKVKSVKTTGSREGKYGIEEEAEVQVEKVDMNEMVNIFYKLENAPMVLSVKKTVVKTTFEDPTLLNITMTLSLISPK